MKTFKMAFLYLLFTSFSFGYAENPPECFYKITNLSSQEFDLEQNLNGAYSPYQTYTLDGSACPNQLGFCRMFPYQAFYIVFIPFGNQDANEVNINYMINWEGQYHFPAFYFNKDACPVIRESIEPDWGSIIIEPSEHNIVIYDYHSNPNF